MWEIVLNSVNPLCTLNREPHRVIKLKIKAQPHPRCETGKLLGFSVPQFPLRKPGTTQYLPCIVRVLNDFCLESSEHSLAYGKHSINVSHCYVCHDLLPSLQAKKRSALLGWQEAPVGSLAGRVCALMATF